MFCTKSELQFCLQHHGSVYADKCVVIPNGFDEAIFYEVASNRSTDKAVVDSHGTMLVHSGVIYASADRGPSAFLEALGQPKRKGQENAATLRVVLRATGNDRSEERRVGKEC